MQALLRYFLIRLKKCGLFYQRKQMSEWYSAYMIGIKPKNKGLRMPIMIAFKAVPQSGRFAVQVDKAGVLKCYLVGPAQDGKANKELVKELARILKIKQSDITIMMGEFHRKKTLKINLDITLPELYARLGIEHQQKLL